MTDASREIPYPRTTPGIPMLLLGIALVPTGIMAFVKTAIEGESNRPFVWWLALALGSLFAAVLVFRGLVLINPNMSKVVLLFGHYKGTIRIAGFYWINPFTVRRSVSLRAHNFNSDKLKVNDRIGNPIEIGAVVVWRVEDTAKAQFDVEDFESYVEIQTESALRTMASTHPYDVDDAETGESSLRGSAEIVSAELTTELIERLDMAGIEVHEARLAHLAYAPEIASAMLQRQQAVAVIAARKKIVDGAVGMVEMALDKLNERSIVELDEERKASMVSNLLVVLCSERGTTPVVNTGTLYTVSERKAFLLRVPPELLDELKGWAAQEMRSLNGQIEWTLREALKRRARATDNGARSGRATGEDDAHEGEPPTRRTS